MTRVDEIGIAKFQKFFAPVGLSVSQVPDHCAIPGSHWGPPEAGLTPGTLHLRADTPVHSALHEAAHFICMPGHRRRCLHTDAGGSDLEESAVCYLQICLANHLPGFDDATVMGEMDDWGYSFRLGSTRAWFTGDSDDAIEQLISWGIMDQEKRYLFTLRR